MFQLKNSLSLVLFFNFFLTLSFMACRPEAIEPPATGAYESGIFITNEGVFNQTSGTVSYYDGQQSEQAIFRGVNGRDLGNVVQSLSRHQSHIYIVVNNSQKIEVVDAASFRSLGRIEGLAQARYFQAINDSIAYVSEWGNDGLTGALVRVNLQEQRITGRIPCTAGPERMQLFQDQLYTVHTGGYNDAQQLSILDLNTHTLQYVDLADRPSSLQFDQLNRLWVLCSGNIEYSSFPQIDSAASSAGALICVNPQDQSIIRRFDFPLGKAPQQLQRDATGSNLYYYWNEGIYRFSSQASQLPTVPLLRGNFYSIGYLDGEIWASSSSGIDPATAYRFDSGGVPLDSFEVGVFPSGFF